MRNVRPFSLDFRIAKSASSLSFHLCWLADTPGLHLHHRLPHMLTPDELRVLHPRKRLCAFVPPTPLDVCTGGASKSSSPHDKPAHQGSYPVSASYFWGNIVRIDILKGPANTLLAFYGPPCLRVASLPLVGDDDGTEVRPSDDTREGTKAGNLRPTALETAGCASSLCVETVATRGGLVPHLFKMKGSGGKECVGDLAVSGLPGWVSIWAPHSHQDITVRVWTPRGVEAFLRPPIPCPSPIDTEATDTDSAKDALRDQFWEDLGLGPTESSVMLDTIAEMVCADT